MGLGHEVHLLCQDRHPERQPFVDAAGDWEQGELRVRTLRRPVRCTVYRPEIGGLLPVYVEDPYEGIEARAFARCGEEEIERYIDANVAAVRELVERVRPDVALANHLVMGPAILARALAQDAPRVPAQNVPRPPADDAPCTPDDAPCTPHDAPCTPHDAPCTPHDAPCTPHDAPCAPAHNVPYAVKVHGSALEYTVKPDPERFLPYAREGLEPAEAILVGSLHTARSLWDALEDPAIEARTRLGPPGVDVDLFKPLPQHAASRAPEPVVAFVGKLIVNKGVDLLIAAWPLVLEQVPEARLEIVGFGGDQEWLERLLEALASGDLRSAGDHARRHLTGFLGQLEGSRRERYLAAARALPKRARFAGRMEHDGLAQLLPNCEALVVPSTFPEAFGMVAAEGAACGALPVSAAHSGLAEVSRVLADAVPAQAAEWLSFPVDDHAVPAIARCLVGWLQADAGLRAQTRAGLVRTVREHWSWEGVGRGVIAAVSGQLDVLLSP